jgi:hypothetical protein
MKPDKYSKFLYIVALYPNLPLFCGFYYIVGKRAVAGLPLGNILDSRTLQWEYMCKHNLAING